MADLPLRCIEVDNRRMARRRPQPYHRLVDESRFASYTRPKGLDVLHLDRQVLRESGVVRVRGGDGTNAALLNLFRQVGNRSVVFWHEGGGSANTLLKCLARGKREKIPSHLEELFPSHSFEARLCFPLRRESEDGLVEYGAYLAGFSHLAIETTCLREALARRRLDRNLSLAYVISGLASAAPWSFRRRIQPSHVSYRAKGIAHELGGLMAACTIITVPTIGTFDFEEPIEDTKVRLLTLTASNEVTLLSKYLLTLIIGGMFPRGPDSAVRWGVIGSHDVDEVVVYPGTPHSHARPNCCLDGEVEQHGVRTRMTRSQNGTLFIIPKALIEEIYARVPS